MSPYGYRVNELLIFGHPRSRTNYVCSHIKGFPIEAFDIEHLSDDLSIDFKIKRSPQWVLQSGLAEKYIEKISLNMPSHLKIFGFHLEQWPQASEVLSKIKKPILRIYRENKKDAIISLLIGQRRGFTSFSEKTCPSFIVEEDQFLKAFHAVVTLDEKWSAFFRPNLVVEYNEVPDLIKSGQLSKYGVESQQLYPLHEQKSLELAPQLIQNFNEIEEWYTREMQKKNS